MRRVHSSPLSSEPEARRAELRLGRPRDKSVKPFGDVAPTGTHCEPDRTYSQAIPGAKDEKQRCPELRRNELRNQAMPLQIVACPSGPIENLHPRKQHASASICPKVPGE